MQLIQIYVTIKVRDLLPVKIKVIVTLIGSNRITQDLIDSKNLINNFTPGWSDRDRYQWCSLCSELFKTFCVPIVFIIQFAQNEQSDDVHPIELLKQGLYCSTSQNAPSRIGPCFNNSVGWTSSDYSFWANWIEKTIGTPKFENFRTVRTPTTGTDYQLTLIFVAKLN